MIYCIYLYIYIYILVELLLIQVSKSEKHFFRIPPKFVGNFNKSQYQIPVLGIPSGAWETLNTRVASWVAVVMLQHLVRCYPLWWLAAVLLPQVPNYGRSWRESNWPLLRKTVGMWELLCFGSRALHENFAHVNSYVFCLRVVWWFICIYGNHLRCFQVRICTLLGRQPILTPDSKSRQEKEMVNSKITSKQTVSTSLNVRHEYQPIWMFGTSIKQYDGEINYNLHLHYNSWQTNPESL